GDAGPMHDALFAGVEAQDRHALVATDQLGVAPGRTRDLTALARLELDVVDDRAHRHGCERHRVARLHVNRLARDHPGTAAKALRSQDVAQLAILVLDQRDEGGPVRIVLDPLDGRRHVELRTLEVDDAVRTLVTAANEAGRDTAEIVAAARRLEADRQTLDGLALVKARTVDDHQLARARRNRLVFL